MHLHDYRCTGCGRHYSHDHDNDKVPVCTTEGCDGSIEVEKFGFRCKNCGHLVHATHGGENEVPNSCPACGAGIHIGYDPQAFHREIEALIPKGKALSDKEFQALSTKLHAKVSALPTTRTYFPDNWEILADLDDAALKERGLDRDRVVRHTPQPPSAKKAPPKNVIVGAAEVLRGSNKTLGKVN